MLGSFKSMLPGTGRSGWVARLPTQHRRSAHLLPRARTGKGGPEGVGDSPQRGVLREAIEHLEQLLPNALLPTEPAPKAADTQASAVLRVLCMHMEESGVPLTRGPQPHCPQPAGTSLPARHALQAPQQLPLSPREQARRAQLLDRRRTLERQQAEQRAKVGELERALATQRQQLARLRQQAVQVRRSLGFKHLP